MARHLLRYLPLKEAIKRVGRRLRMKVASFTSFLIRHLKLNIQSRHGGTSLCLNRLFVQTQSSYKLRNNFKIDVLTLRVHTKRTLHFGISYSGHFWQILKAKNLERVHSYCVFWPLKYTKPNQNLSAKSVKLFLCAP